MAKDKFHYVVKTALEKEGWQITADPYEININDVDFEIDLAAEQLLAATRDNQKIAVEVKSFISPSNVSDFHTALGQFLNYRDALELLEPNRSLYLAVRSPVYESFFQRRFIAAAVQRYCLEITDLRCATGGYRSMAVDQYKQHIRKILSDRAGRVSSQHRSSEYEVQTVFDDEQGHYQLLYVGWRGNQRDFGCVLHLDIKAGKIWVQHDGTEVGVANELTELGVPKQDIVLAFHEPEVRQFTGFAVG